MDSIKNKKYDLIVGNPPYDRSLHLKIIEASMQHLSDKGEACFIHPARWIEDTLWIYKKNSDHKKFMISLCKHFKSIQFISTVVVNKLFNIGSDQDLMIAIYSLKSCQNIHIYPLIIYSILEKIISNDNLRNHIEYNTNKGWRIEIKKMLPLGNDLCHISTNSLFHRYRNVMICPICSIFKDGYDSHHTYWIYTRKAGKKYLGNEKIPVSIPFQTEKQAKYFQQSVTCKFYQNLIHMIKFDINTPLFALPYIIDDEHGEYDKPWTNEDYCKYFDLTEEESQFMCREVYDYREKDFINYYEI